MKRLAVLAALLLSTASFAQPGQGNRPPDNRPPSNNRPGPGGPPGGGPSMGKPDRPVTLPAPAPGRPGGPQPGKPGGPPPRPPGPGMRPPDRPSWNWHGGAHRPIAGPAFRYPHGYSYRRWSVGAFLPSLFLSTVYYYNDWRTLGIDPPPPGRRWVRYGPDLLLVNTRTRRVEDVIYGVFY